MRIPKLLGMAIVLALIGAACGGADDGGAITPPGGETPANGRTHDVTGTTTNTFDPAEITVAVGDTVSWEWMDAVPGHNVTAVNDEFNSGDPIPDGSFEFTFTEAGTVEYYCTVHGTADGSGMFATVTVN